MPVNRVHTHKLSLDGDVLGCREPGLHQAQGARPWAVAAVSASQPGAKA